MKVVIYDIVNAAGVGGLYALAALGIALIFGVMRLINFAHGELIMAGGYALLLLDPLPWPATILLTLVAVATLAVLMERVAFRPIRDAAPATLLVTSFFVSLVIQNIAILILGSRPKGLSIMPGLLDEVSIAGIGIQKMDLVIVAVSIGLLALVGAFLTRTLVGIQIRAASEDFTMARLLGIRGNRVIPTAFLVSGILAGVVSIFIVARAGSVHPAIGLQPVLIGFVATVLGGMGSLKGAVVGGFILGAVTVELQSHLPGGLAPYREAFLFAGVIVLLLWKPEGIMPTKLTGERV